MIIALAFAVMGAGTYSHQEEEKDAHVVIPPFAIPSTWQLVGFEDEGKKEKRSGKLEIRPNGLGVIDIFPRAPWTIVASRTTGDDAYGVVELDIKWDGEFAGEDTLYSIYAVLDNRLWLCFVGKGYKRPSNFVTHARDGRTLLVFRPIN